MLAIIASILLVSVATAVLVAAEPKPQEPISSVEGMFPGGVSSYLARFEEPPLGQPPKSDPAVATLSSRYRITRLRPGALLCLNISFTVKDPRAKVATATPHVVLKQGGFGHPDARGAVLSATDADLKPLFDAFRDEELFSLPARTEELRFGMDGQTWVFERWQLGRYRVVARWQPERGPGKICADAVLEFLHRVQNVP